MTTLISGYLERISSKIFDDYHKEITTLIGKERGVYALYKKDKLYYVGLATNLRMRVKQHLKDRHGNKWDSFSLYLIHNTDHLRELESLLIRITEPKGNLTSGNLGRSGNLLKSLRQSMEERNKRYVEKILTTHKTKKSLRQKVFVRRKREITLVELAYGKKIGMLEGLLPAGTELRVVYKKQEYNGFVDNNGRIEVNGKTYTSPSSAGSAITGKPIDGWLFWKYLNSEGKWVKIDNLRKSKQ